MTSLAQESACRYQPNLTVLPINLWIVSWMLTMIANLKVCNFFFCHQYIDSNQIFLHKVSTIYFCSSLSFPYIIFTRWSISNMLNLIGFRSLAHQWHFEKGNCVSLTNAVFIDYIEILGNDRLWITLKHCEIDRYWRVVKVRGWGVGGGMKVF